MLFPLLFNFFSMLLLPRRLLLSLSSFRHVWRGLRILPLLVRHILLIPLPMPDSHLRLLSLLRRFSLTWLQVLLVFQPFLSL
nr:hypothetical protein GZ9D8_28 [uncultured archaeon GZfos9D8]